MQYVVFTVRVQFSCLEGMFHYVQLAIDDKYCMAFHCHACFLVQFPFLTL